MRPATLRAFLLLCDELAAWPDRFDPTVIGPALPHDRWTTLRDSIDAGVAFLHTARQARTAANAAADTPVSR